MRQIRISKRHTHSAGWQQEPLRLDPRDPDKEELVHPAKLQELAAEHIKR